MLSTNDQSSKYTSWYQRIYENKKNIYMNETFKGSNISNTACYMIYGWNFLEFYVISFFLPQAFSL